jgi:hypothetical protein
VLHWKLGYKPRIRNINKCHKWEGKQKQQRKYNNNEEGTPILLADQESNNSKGYKRGFEGYSSVVGLLPTMHEILGSILSTAKHTKK